MENTNKSFDDFICEKCDELDNLAYNLLCAVAAKNNTQTDETDIVPWDMSQIAELEDAAKDILHESNIPVCHPFYEGDEETPCYQGSSCDKKNCPFIRKE